MRISDWSSDVCSSDLPTIPTIAIASGTSLIFSQVEHHLVDSSPALLAHRFGAGPVHFRLREQSIGIMIAWRRWRGCVAGGKIGRAPVRTPVTTAHLVCRDLLANTKNS